MDYQKKKLLTQSVAFMQAYLTLTPGLLDAMRVSGIFTDEEVTTILSDEMTSGKVVEMVCLLKRKDNRTYSRFVEVLDSNNCTAVVGMLKHKGEMDSNLVIPDPRTVHFLEKFLKQTQVCDKTIKDMSLNIVLREIYQDEINRLQEKLQGIQRKLRSRPLRPSVDGSGSDSSRPSSAMSNRPTWDVPNKMEELVEMLREKDKIIKRKDTEYEKLRVLLNDTQNHLESVLELNNNYLTIIGQLNTLQMTGATPRASEKDREIAELEQKLAEAEESVQNLSCEFTDICAELTTQQSEAERLAKREKKYKGILGLSPDAPEEQVTIQIRKLMQDGTMQKRELEKINRELKEVSTEKSCLQEKMCILERDKDKVEFHMRQQDLMIKRMQRQKVASKTIPFAQEMIAQHANHHDGPLAISTRLPSLGRPNSSRSPSKSRQYCVFCRTEFFPFKSPTCRIHFRAIRESKWTCCKDECHRSAGCLQVPHFYIEITVDKKIFLTDGGRYWELS